MSKFLDPKQLAALADYLLEAKQANYQIPGTRFTADPDANKALSFRHSLTALVAFGSGIDAEFGKKYKTQLGAARDQDPYFDWLINFAIQNAEEIVAMADTYKAHIEEKRIDALFSKTIAQMTGYEFQEYLQRIGIIQS